MHTRCARLSKREVEPYIDALSSGRWSAVNAIVVVATLLMWPLAASAQLQVLISGGFSGAYERLLPEFERTTGSRVTS